MNAPRQLVPLAIALTSLLSGCFLMHGADDAPSPEPAPRPVLDAGPSARDSGSPPPPLDADVAPMGCGVRAMDFVCTDRGNGAIPVGVPYPLPIAIGDLDECHCGETIECDAVVEGPRTLSLETVLCASPATCFACEPFVLSTCELPPLDEGLWHVRVNGQDAFDVNVYDATPGEGPVERCHTSAEGDPFCPPEWAPMPEAVDQICLPAAMPSGRVTPVDVTDFCLPCGYVVGSCEVVRSADEIRVMPTSLPPTCDVDCDAECSLHESRCAIPPLEPGDYVVHVDGLAGSLPLHVERGIEPGPGRSCLSVPED